MNIVIAEICDLPLHNKYFHHRLFLGDMSSRHHPNRRKLRYFALSVLPIEFGSMETEWKLTTRLDVANWKYAPVAHIRQLHASLWHYPISRPQLVLVCKLCAPYSKNDVFKVWVKRNKTAFVLMARYHLGRNLGRYRLLRGLDIYQPHGNTQSCPMTVWGCVEAALRRSLGAFFRWWCHPISALDTPWSVFVHDRAYPINSYFSGSVCKSLLFYLDSSCIITTARPSVAVSAVAWSTVYPLSKS